MTVMTPDRIAVAIRTAIALYLLAVHFLAVLGAMSCWNAFTLERKWRKAGKR